jgi:hypothetical protein
VVLPTVSVVMLAEFFVIRRIVRAETNFDVVPTLTSLPRVRWAALISLSAGLAVGLVTSGLIPGLDAFHVGLCAVQAWLTALVVYLPLRLWELNSAGAVASPSPSPRPRPRPPPPPPPRPPPPPPPPPPGPPPPKPGEAALLESTRHG